MNVPRVMRLKLGTSLAAQSSDKCNDGSAADQSEACRWVTQAERPKRWADLSNGASDVGSASTEHHNLDRDAAEQELLEKMRDAWPQIPQKILETR